MVWLMVWLLMNAGNTPKERGGRGKGDVSVREQSRARILSELRFCLRLGKTKEKKYTLTKEKKLFHY